MLLPQSVIFFFFHIIILISYLYLFIFSYIINSSVFQKMGNFRKFSYKKRVVLIFYAFKKLFDIIILYFIISLVSGSIYRIEEISKYSSVK